MISSRFITISICQLALFVQIGNAQANELYQGSENPYSWGSMKHQYAKDSVKCLDLLEIESYLSGETLVFQMNWNDDIIDSKPISQEIRRWKDPKGEMRDKDLMYYFDDIGIRIFLGDDFYEGWIYPNKVTNRWEVQWENQGSMKTRTSSPVEIIQIENEDSLTERFKVWLDFNQMGWELSSGRTLKVTIIAADADTPPIKDIRERIVNQNSGPSYCVSMREFRIK